MVTFGTREKYSHYDWRFGTTGINIDDLPTPAGEVIEHNQDEFRANSMYCTLYACFTAYSIFTGKHIPLDIRLKIIQDAIEAGVLSDQDGAWLHEAVDFFRNYMSDLDGVDYVTYRVPMGSGIFDRVVNKGYPVITGYLTSADYRKDRQDNCVIDDIATVSGGGSAGHALCDYRQDKPVRIDNYRLRSCNIYGFGSDNVYNTFIRNFNIHFRFGYIFTSLEGNKMSQEQKDREDIKWAIDNGITNGELLEETATRGQVALMISRAIQKYGNIDKQE